MKEEVSVSEDNSVMAQAEGVLTEAAIRSIVDINSLTYDHAHIVAKIATYLADHLDKYTITPRTLKVLEVYAKLVEVRQYTL